jgi:hypothetical protein
VTIEGSDVQLPYQRHTNRELGLMLKGVKPLAVFADWHGQYPEVVLRYLRLFDRHVASGRFVRRDHLQQAPRYVVHYILFALPDEAWRIDAMIELKESESWSPDHERREGELLGYEDWMNDHWLKLFHPDAKGG